MVVEEDKEEQKTALLLVVFETEQKELSDMFVSSVLLWRSKKEEKTEDFLYHSERYDAPY